MAFHASRDPARPIAIPCIAARSGRLWGVEPDPHDPVVQRREKLLKLTSAGQRFGYSCFGLAMVLFVVALLTQLPSWLVTTIVVLMVAGSVVLLPAIIISYGAKAADKEDRGEPFSY